MCYRFTLSPALKIRLLLLLFLLLQRVLLECSRDRRESRTRHPTVFCSTNTIHMGQVLLSLWCGDITRARGRSILTHSASRVIRVIRVKRVLMFCCFSARLRSRRKSTDASSDEVGPVCLFSSRVGGGKPRVNHVITIPVRAW